MTETGTRRSPGHHGNRTRSDKGRTGRNEVHSNEVEKVDGRLYNSPGTKSGPGPLSEQVRPSSKVDTSFCLPGLVVRGETLIVNDL